MKPTVTVIVPVFNAEEWLEEVLNSLCNQSYSKERTEIIVVDDGSSDNSRDIIRRYPVQLLRGKGSRNPYVARNLGLKSAKGEVIAFTDANKIPCERWIENGVESLLSQKADLVGGHIRFRVDERSGAAEIYDSITFNNNKMLTEREQAAVTGNLFVKRDLFKVLDKFPERMRSGMDVWWTRRAAELGFNLHFSEKAVVYCIPRKLKGVLRKSVRVGRSHPYNMRSAGMSFAAIATATVKTFAPPRVSKLKQQLKDSPFPASIGRVWIVAWLSKIGMGWGRLQGLTQLKKEMD